MQLPPEFIEKVEQIFGEKGRAWLPELPGIAAQCREKWGLRQGVISSHISMNYVEFTETAAGEAVAVKIGVPHSELFTEMEALRLYDGVGAARLLDANSELGAILMQRLRPGTMLWQLGDNERETRIAAETMRRLWAPEPSQHTLPHFSQWIERAFHSTRTEWDPQELMPRDLLDKAEFAFDGVAEQSSHDVLLHGDLHHENILLDEKLGWLAIDPKGVIGAPILEVGRFMHNRLDGSWSTERRAEVVRERVQIFSAELGYGPEIVAAGALVDCVLSHSWSLDDDGEVGADWHIGIETGRLLSELAGF